MPEGSCFVCGLEREAERPRDGDENLGRLVRDERDDVGAVDGRSNLERGDGGRDNSGDASTSHFDSLPLELAKPDDELLESSDALLQRGAVRMGRGGERVVARLHRKDGRRDVLELVLEKPRLEQDFVHGLLQ